MTHLDIEDKFGEGSHKEFYEENVFDENSFEKSLFLIEKYFGSNIDNYDNYQIEDENIQIVENWNKIKSSIQTHSEKLTDELKETKKRFQCSYKDCDRSYREERILRSHMKSHTKSGVYNCEYSKCGKVYKSRENLNLHVKNKHLGVKPYKCSFCESHFTHRNGKTYHERKMHSLYLPYKCDLTDCAKSFANKSSLNYHMKKNH